MRRLDGIRALVVGGASGIGRAVVEAFAAEGAAVAVIDRDGREAVAGAVATAAADAADPSAVSAAVASATASLGGLDSLVHTAGVHDGFLRDLTEVDIATLAAAAEEVLSVNVASVLLAVHACLPWLRESARASVTLTASESAFASGGGGPLYGASKWAVRGLVTHLAVALAPGVRVNGVAPGATAGTRLAGAGALGGQQVGQRPGRDEAIRSGTRLEVLVGAADVAAAYTYLAAPAESRAVTGTIVNVDGGRASL